jgi:hypothetical protein
MKSIITLFISALLASGIARAATIAINFDTDASGSPLNSPTAFSSTKHLAELYAPLGVHFAGPGGNDGGAILDQGSNFGINAHSGLQFLAFNRAAGLADLGIARDPEKITFDLLMSDVAVFVGGGSVSRTFRLDAFDTDGVLVNSKTVATRTFSQLQVASSAGIRAVTLSVTDTDVGAAFIVDDLLAHTIPEPSAALLLCAASLLAGSMRKANPRRHAKPETAMA